MSATTPHFSSRYSTHLNILHAAGEVIDVAAVVAANKHPWYNQTLCRVNESVVRLGSVQGEYHWHKHDHEDEMFFVIEGEFNMELRDKTIVIKENEFIKPSNNDEEQLYQKFKDKKLSWGRYWCALLMSRFEQRY